MVTEIMQSIRITSRPPSRIIYTFLSIFPPHFDLNKKVVRTRSNCPVKLAEWTFLDHTFYVFVDEVVTKIFVYLLITNFSLYENVVNLFEHDMKIQISFESVNPFLVNCPILYSLKHRKTFVFLVFSGV